ncbi:MAG TPA: beta-ketoacyl-ACP synthase II [Planctomycetota bacterium]|nr:beta-ketoacyl-ACP synthase II [Planctomycetota bacterium]
MTKRRVVITGLGAVTPLGLDMESTWDALLAGTSGAGPITRFDTSDFATKFACEVKGFDPERWLEKTEARKLDPFTWYMLAASDQAMQDCGLDRNKIDLDRFGCIFGTGIGGILELELTAKVFEERGPRRISPFFITKMICNASAGYAAIRYGLRGTSLVTVSACASSSHAIGLALRTIQYGDADFVLTGGSEAAVTRVGIGAFCANRALSTRNDDPAHASRPFDRDRDGFVMGEGAAALVLEEYEHARRRGARIYAELMGFGSTDDAYHITAPNEDGAGLVRAVRAALADAQIPPDAVDYVNAHGTSTPLNDKIETRALKQVFGAHASRLAVNSTKSMVGHMLGGAGAIEAAVCALSVERGQVHPTINLENPDPECDLDYVPGTARDLRARVAISNSLGFGGHNTCLVLGRLDR